MTINSYECVHPHDYESAPSEDVLDDENSIQWFDSENRNEKSDGRMLIHHLKRKRVAGMPSHTTLRGKHHALPVYHIIETIEYTVRPSP